MNIILSVCRRKSSSGTNNAEQLETTPNVYGASNGNSQHAGNGIPLDERSNNPVGTGSVEESPYMNASNASAPPSYAVLYKNRPGNIQLYSPYKSWWQFKKLYIKTKIQDSVVQSEASAPAFFMHVPLHCFITSK